MNCPHCGSPMKEEQVFCEVCGKERQLVPVFDAQIDETLQSTMSSIVDDLANTQEIVPNEIEERLKEAEREKNSSEEELSGTKDLSQPESEPEPEFELGFSDEEAETKKTGISNAHLILWGVTGIFAALFLGVVIFVLSLQTEDESENYENQIKTAEQMEQKEDYEQMLASAREAVSLAPNSSDAKMMMARAYVHLDEPDMAISTLEILLDADHAYISAYDMLIELYAQQGRYEDIGNLLESCKEQEVLDKYVSYLSAPPAFSEAEGVYQKMLSLKLIAPGQGDIYYTIDGSDPYENGEKFMTPIILGPGEYTVCAYYLNIYGIPSEMIKGSYTIEMETLEDEPYVLLESGFYDQPQLIIAEGASPGSSLHYTTNGSDPTAESSVYERPIPLPLGESEYAFAVIREDETVSEIVRVSYNFVPDTAITLDQIRNMLVQALVQNGTLLDSGGHIAEADGYRNYNVYSAFTYNDQFHFLIAEEYVAPEGSIQRTGRLYAVNAATGECFEAHQNATGTFDVSRLE